MIGEEVWGDGLQLLFRLAEAMTQGMTAAARERRRPGGAEHAELTAVACLMMLERVNYLLSVEVRLPREEMVDRHRRDHLRRLHPGTSRRPAPAPCPR